MLTFLKKISQYRSVVLIILLAPIFSLFFNFDKGLQLVPKDSFVRFEVQFFVPGKMSSEIEKKVTTVAEKIFNGLPHLISLESLTKHEQSTLTLIFEKLKDPDKILLFIQEKLDRLKVSLPSDVKQIKTQHLKSESLPDIEIKIPKDFNPMAFKNFLENKEIAIKKVRPLLSEGYTIFVKIDPKNLLKYNISINQIWHSLKINGFSSRLGKKNDLSYFVESTFDNISKLKSTIIGVKKNNPIKLIDVASIELRPPRAPQSIKLWIDYEKGSLNEVLTDIRNTFPHLKLEKKKISLWISLLEKPLLFFILFFIIEILVFSICLKNIRAAGSAIIFSLGFTTHYPFWCLIFKGELTLFDFYSLILGLIFGSFLWLCLLSKIRSLFYVTSPLETKKNLQQSILFSMSELIPTYLILIVLFYLFSFPTLSNNINLPSTKILTHFFEISVPIIFYFLVILSVFSPLSWTMEEGKKRNPIKLFSRNVFVPILILIFLPLSLYSWSLKPLGMIKKNFSHNKKNSLKSEVYTNLSLYRGYEYALIYKTGPGKVPPSFKKVPDKFLTNEWINQWFISPTGLRHLAQLDITSFKMAMEEIQQKKRISFLTIQEGLDEKVFPIKLSPLLLDERNFSSLLIGSKNTNVPSKNLGHITKKEMTLLPKSIFHEQITRADQFYFSHGEKINFLKRPLDPSIKPTSLTKKWRSGHKNFLRDHIVSFIFIFTFLSLYMNSFYRGWIITVICLAQSGISSGLLFLQKDILPLDSLWLENLPQWLSLAIILILTRPIDLERLRGNDFEDSLSKIEIFFARAVFGSLILFASGPLIIGLLSLNKGPSFSFLLTESSLFFAVLTFVFGLISYRFLFFSFYMSSEKTIDKITLFILKIFYKIKNKRKLPLNS